MKLPALILFVLLSLFLQSIESKVAHKPVKVDFDESNEDEGDLDDLKKTKRVSVVNDLEGDNVVANIKGTEINQNARGRSARNHAMEDHANEAIKQINELINSLKNSQDIAERIMNHEIESKKDLRKAKKKLNDELQSAKENCKKLSRAGQMGTLDDEAEETLNDTIEELADVAEKLANDRSSSMESDEQAAREVWEELARTLPTVMDLGHGPDVILKENKRRHNEKKNQSDEEQDEQVVENLERAIKLAKTADDKTLRRFAMQNRVKGSNVVVNQDFEEMNARRHQQQYNPQNYYRY